MKKHLLIAFVALAGYAMQPADAQAGEAYIGGELIGGAPQHDFGGFNTIGGFFNNDQQRETVAGIALTFGLRDRFQVGGLAITPEVELAWFKDYNITSASFVSPPPFPSFFYQSSVSTGRLGVNLWTPFHNDDVWRAEAGAGLGVLYRDIRTNDTVVGGSGDDYALYGKVGVRFIRSFGTKGSLTLGANYVASGKTNLPLVGNFGGLPAGNLSLQTSGPEIRIGYQYSFGN